LTVAAPVRFLAWSESIGQPKLLGMTILTLNPDDLDAFRAILREQLAGDYEHLRDLQAGATVRAPEVYGAAPTRARITLVERLARQVGGLY
jgi:hypothetical protein